MKNLICVRHITPALLCLMLASGVTSSAWARKSPREHWPENDSFAETSTSIRIPATGEIEMAFSPNEGSEALVIKVIRSAQRDIRALSYSFTNARITQALIEARHRGVAITLVSDYKNNISEDRSGKARAALSALSTAGVDVRLISVYPIHHETLIVDGETVETGSFNFTDAAAHRNSENVLVNWHNPALAKVYLQHFERNYRQSMPYRPAY